MTVEKEEEEEKEEDRRTEIEGALATARTLALEMPKVLDSPAPVDHKITSLHSLPIVVCHHIATTETPTALVGGGMRLLIVSGILIEGFRGAPVKGEGPLTHMGLGEVVLIGGG